MSQGVRLVTIVVILLLGGCMTTTENSILSSWEGEHIDAVVIQWGIPERTYPQSDGSTIFEWSTPGGAYMPGQSSTVANTYGNTTYATTTFTPGVVINATCRRAFIVGKDNIIKTWQWSGNNCCVIAVAGYCASLANPRTKAENNPEP